MRIANWAPDKYDGEFNEEAMRRLTECAEVVADWARVKAPAGEISRPIYEKGKHAGQIWTAREPWSLRRSIRVVRKKTKGGLTPRHKGSEFLTTKGGHFWKRSQNVRVIAGNFKIFYARFVEFGTSKTKKQAFLRPALYSAIPEIRSIMGVR